jgi:hypothetical protein
VRSYRERMSFKPIPEEDPGLRWVDGKFGSGHWCDGDTCLICGGDRLDAARGMIFVTLAGLAISAYALWWLW